MFGAPDNPRPTLWFTMREPFAYISATLDLSRKPIMLASNETLTTTYGVAVWDGDVEDETVQAMYGKWVELIKRPL